MTLVRFKQQPLFNDNFNNAMQNFFTPFSSLYRDDSAAEKKLFVPVNITETDAGFGLQVIAPGFKKEDFKIDLNKNILTISAKTAEESKDEKQIRNEYTFSAFTRSFTLTKGIDSEAISAEYVNGVLVLNLPKKAEVKTPVKQISVN